MPDQPYRIGRLRGGFVLVFDEDGKRRRYRIDAKSAAEANRVAPALYAALTKPEGKTVASLWEGYVRAKAGHAVIATMAHTWKAVRDRFGPMEGEAITTADCRAHVEARRRAGIKNGTLATELGHLSNVLRWAEREQLIAKAPHIERPSRGAPKMDYLTRDQARALMAATVMPHVRIYIVLALTTGARNAALLGLTWTRCDLDRGLVDFRDPEIVVAHKGRAIVPINRTLRAALQDARASALSDHVVEWAGKRVASVKKGLAEAGRRAGIGKVSPHMLRHSAAVHMAEDGVPISEIAQFLGHSNERITYSTYARFSPDYLRGAAAALEYDGVAVVTGRKKA